MKNNWKGLTVVAALAWVLVALVMAEVLAAPPEPLVLHQPTPPPGPNPNELTDWGPWGVCNNGLRGDANCSGVVDIWDYWNFVLPALWSEPGDNHWRPGADLNRNGRVGVGDEQIIFKNLGRTLMHLKTGTGKGGRWGEYWSVTELADGTPWPLTVCVDSGPCWQWQWNEYGWYEWTAIASP